jgi:hypothetical protein
MQLFLNRSPFPLFTFLAELEFVLPHIHFSAPEGNAFGFQSESLFERRFATQLNLSSGAYYSLPWQADRRMQRGSHTSGGAGETCGARNCSVS